MGRQRLLVERGADPNAPAPYPPLNERRPHMGFEEMWMPEGHQTNLQVGGVCRRGRGAPVLVDPMLPPSGCKR